MNNNYKELNIQKSLYRGCGESFAERLEKMDPTPRFIWTGIMNYFRIFSCFHMLIM